MRESARTCHRLMTRRHLRGSIDVEVALFRQSLHEIVEKLRELFLGVFVAVAAQRFEQFRSELTALDQRIENCLLQCLEGAVGLLVVIAPWIVLLSAGEA